jgi:cell wall-associated NlpC family hydrolase/LysM repeat protein
MAQQHSSSFRTRSASQPASLRQGLSPSKILPYIALSAIALPALVRADAYHSVEPGETLVSVATRYNTKVEVLRTLNKLSANETAILPSMLLRVPENSSATSTGSSLPGLNLEKSTAPAAHSETLSTRGSISRAVRYTVREGDTAESIADRYTQSGQNVTAHAIREKNRLEDQPRVGSTIIVPLGSATYVASAQRYPQTQPRSPQSSRQPAVQISDQFEWPVAEMATTAQPVYQAPNKTRIAQVPREAPSRGGSPAARRGPTNLSSRGYFPNANLDGARVLRQNEDAPNAAPPRPRSRTVTAPQPQPQAAAKLARVAKVSINGGRIRRLPDSQAVTLYSCPVSTEIAVIKQSGAWSAILMSDRSTGWIPTRYLRFTSASVDISQIKINDGYDNLRRTGPKGYAIAGNFSSAQPMVANALTYMGTPYVYGGTSRRGIDCSSLVQHAFSANGVRLPRTAAQQARVGRAVQPSELQAGDRLYFSASGTRIDHTGLYMGDGLFVHASGTGRKVIVSNLYDRYNWNIFVGARR